MLKALYVDIKEDYPPKTHNLIVLLKSIEIDVSEEMEAHLIEINSFNMEARYPDEKFEFYKKCTSDFAGHYFAVIEEIKNWLRKRL